MTLEDHIGDILCKARAMSKVAPAAAAAAAGLTEDQYARLEETGEGARNLPFPALAALLHVDAAKLEAIARGWLPVARELGTWRELRVISTTAGGMAVNCYLAWDEVSRDAALFDTGWEAGPILDLVRSEQLQLRHLFITHGHEDHVAALDELRANFPKIRIHSGSKSAPVDQRNRPNDFIHLGSLRITNRDTPGHAEDGATYVIGTWPEDAPHVAIVGDAIFAGSIGRGNVSWDLARQKVRDQVFSLPPDTLICPGHGPLTTVAEEKAHNPFF